MKCKHTGVPSLQRLSSARGRQCDENMRGTLPVNVWRDFSSGSNIEPVSAGRWVVVVVVVVVVVH